MKLEKELIKEGGDTKEWDTFRISNGFLVTNNNLVANRRPSRCDQDQRECMTEFSLTKGNRKKANTQVGCY